jgi:hypothetical protein
MSKRSIIIYHQHKLLDQLHDSLALSYATVLILQTDEALDSGIVLLTGTIAIHCKIWLCNGDTLGFIIEMCKLPLCKIQLK